MPGEGMAGNNFLGEECGSYEIVGAIGIGQQPPRWSVSDIGLWSFTS